MGAGHPEELPDDFHGKHLGVGEFGSRAALAQLLIFEPVVREAENGRDEGALGSTREDLLYVLSWRIRHHQA